MLITSIFSFNGKDHIHWPEYCILFKVFYQRFVFYHISNLLYTYVHVILMADLVINVWNYLFYPLKWIIHLWRAKFKKDIVNCQICYDMLKTNNNLDSTTFTIFPRTKNLHLSKRKISESVLLTEQNIILRTTFVNIKY